MSMTTEFSFVLKPSEHGVGVFAVHDISKGEHLRLFPNESEPRTCVANQVPELFQEYCLGRGETLLCPEDFGCMSIGWYLNHSSNPNAVPDEELRWYALRDIRAGEEIVIDYNSLKEPPEDRADYYAS